MNNHTTRLVLGGLADPSVAQYLPELFETRRTLRHVPLRQRPPGTGSVIAGHRPVFDGAPATVVERCGGFAPEA